MAIFIREFFSLVFAGFPQSSSGVVFLWETREKGNGEGQGGGWGGDPHRNRPSQCARVCQNHPLVKLGPVHGRTDFLRIFIFEPPDFFADFLAGFFLLIFVGKSAQKNPPRKSPGKSSKIYTTKIPDTFLQRGRAKLKFLPAEKNPL